jgi:RNA polymerase sigma-70 factor (ECF subfamily)
MVEKINFVAEVANMGKCGRGAIAAVAGHAQILEHVPGLRRYARALMNDRDRADDLVQDTIERALQCMGQFECGTNLRVWLFSIMHKLFANQVRRRSVRAVHVCFDDESLSESEFAVSTTPIRSPELHDLDYALRRLPVEQRQVALLVGLEELCYADAARVLEIHLGTVLSRLSRGRERLRAVIAGRQATTTTNLKDVRTEASCIAKYR